MKYNSLAINHNKQPKRVGRGIAAGQGKTAGRGTKGQKSRAGSSRRPGFEGGQNPLIQRLPKLRGFRSTRPIVENVRLEQLESLGKQTIDNHVLAEAGLVSGVHTSVKLIGVTKLSKKLNVQLQYASSSAIKAIESAGGSFLSVGRIGRVKQKNTKSDKTS